MVRLRVFPATLAILALFGAGPALAAPLTLGGNVDMDFNPANDPGVYVVQDAANDVAQVGWMNDQGTISGWNIKDLRTRYDQASDTLAVGVNFFGIAGDADGNGDPGGADPRALASGGVDMPNLGGRESITVAIDTTNTKTPTIVAGVPADKSVAGPGTDGFTVAAYKNIGQGLAFSYGQTLTDHLGALSYDPSLERSDFEFTIKNFSKLPGLDLSKGFGISAFAGTPDDVVAGEDFIAWTRVPNPLPQQIPEPSTALTWILLAGGATWRLRRLRNSTA